MLRVSPFLSVIGALPRLFCCIAASCLLLPALPASGEETPRHFSSSVPATPPLSTFRHPSRTIPLLDPDGVGDIKGLNPIGFSTPRTALPFTQIRSKAVGNEELAPLKKEVRAQLKTLPGDTSPAAPRLSGFKPLNGDSLRQNPPPRIQQMWNDVLNRHSSERVFGKNSKMMNAFRKEQWNYILSTWKDMEPDKKLRVINGFFNNWPSITDQANYGRKEYWATPEELIRKGGGDCEDYAIAKYLALRYLSWPTKDLWLVLVVDNQKKTNHAVLAARYGSTTFILDNLSKPRYLLIPEKEYMKRYTPFYAVNEDSCWIFAMPKHLKQEAVMARKGEKDPAGIAKSDQEYKR